jgi:GNAT superfamily N-acetyltransferase
MFKIRQAKGNDLNFIYSTWLRSYKHDSPVTKQIKRDLFFKEHQRLIDKIFMRPNINIYMACKDDDEDLVFGYIVYEPKTIHFIYVKESFRKLGIGKRLLGCLPTLNDVEASHLTYSLIELWNAGKLKVNYNPYDKEKNGRSTEENKNG